MKIADIVLHLESLAPPSLQESYDNAGLITGDAGRECTGILCTLDTTEEIIYEAVTKKCNLVVSHHPVIFSGLKKINGKNYVEKTVIAAIKNDIAIYAIHTNLDNVIHGVNGKMAELLQLKNVSLLAAKANTLKKLFTFAPVEHAEQVRHALFKAGGGRIGNYSECSFNAEGTGTFRAGEGSHPYVGREGELHLEKEMKIEVIFPSYLESAVVGALKSAHPYEEPAFDIVPLSNTFREVGSGVLGALPEKMTEEEFFSSVMRVFNIPVIRHSPLLNRSIKKVALCGGAGKFLIPTALAAGADVFLSADIKYHEFFEANSRMVIADIGHFESEQFTIDLLQEILAGKFPTFAVLKTEVNTNPVKYFLKK